MLKILSFCNTVSLLGACFSVYALPPAAPITRLQIEVVQGESDQSVQLNWDKVNFADGYNLLYADYPNFDNLHSVDLGNTVSLTTTLPVGTAFLVAVQAYNAAGGSLVRDIYPIVITPDNQALPMPQVTRKHEGDQLLLSWEAVPNATGYQIRYGDTPNLNRSVVIDIHEATSYTLPLVNGQFSFVGVTAYNETQTSPIALGLTVRQNRIVALVSRDSERQGLLDGFKRFGKQWQDIQLNIIQWETLDTVTTQVQGKQASEGKRGSVRGLLDDPDVLALVTTSTNSTLRVMQI